MELKDVMKLVDAGFTKAEIAQLLEPSKAESTDVSTSVQTAVPDEAPDEGRVLPGQQPDPIAEKMTQLGSALDALEKKIQGINLIQAQMNAEAIRQDTPQDLIGRIINPNSKKEV